MDKRQESMDARLSPATHIAMDQVILRNNALFIAPFDDELVCFDEATGNYYGLNSTARIIWDMLEAPITLQNVIEVMVQSFPDAKDNVIKDVTDFFMALHAIAVISFSEQVFDPTAITLKSSPFTLSPCANFAYVTPIITTILSTTLHGKQTAQSEDSGGVTSVGPS